MAIPVYAFTGFLDAGKTRFLQGTLEDPRFNAGEKTLLLLGEEGEEEYEPEKFSGSNVTIQVIDQEKITEEELEALRKQCRAERVCVELNGMQNIGDFYAKLPESWVIYQEIMFADATTFPVYDQNMRSLVVDKLGGCEMVVFNRVTEDTDKMTLHKIVRSVNRRCDIAYEDLAGNTVFDDIEDPLPFDLSADVVEIGDGDYGLWYQDVNEDMEKYSGKTVRFKAQVGKPKSREKGIFIPGRFVMTCCVEDITFMGYVCLWKDAGTLNQRDWVEVTAKVSIRYHKLYGGLGPVLTAVQVTPAEKGQNYVTLY